MCRMLIHYASIFGLLVLSGAVAGQCSPLVMGGFTLSRGGVFSLADSLYVTTLRSAIETQFSGVRFTASSTLSNNYLTSLDDVFISSATSDGSSITPLTSAEQTALRGFVLGGGTALIFVDNDTFSAGAPVANESLLAPFGLHVTGTLVGFQDGVVVNSANPVATGPAGTAVSIRTNYPGWFDQLDGALQIANLSANGRAEVAAFLPGALGPGSGGVVFFGDSNGMALDGEGTSDDTILILNALALRPSATSVPEPSEMPLIIAVSVLVIAWSGRRAP